jgi:UDP-N-acetylmuramoyl-L-alanyl-D-glutamate--2,6-diaminopimelate ligase
MRLGDLERWLAVAGIASRRHGTGDPTISHVSHDSRRVASDTLFCCVPGARTDGHDHAAAAVAAGAVALVVERPLPIPVPQLRVPSVRAALGPVAAAVHGHPSQQLTIVGVTGTNGKTTTTWLVREILESVGIPCGLLGTLTGARTTPEAPELQEALARFVSEGRRAVAMEVSSHALSLQRVDGTTFAVGVFTNLGRDHLDFHGTMEAYFAAKAKLFDVGRSSFAVVNADDAWGRRLLDQLEVPAVPFRIADAEDLDLGPTRAVFTWRGCRAAVGLGGAFNVANALAALSAVVACGVSAPDAVGALGGARPVPGRFEPVDNDLGLAVVVDYAHTPEGLAAVLEAARAAVTGRVVVVFGCGGDRDPDKRGPMGAVAARLSDRVVVTSDNPRSEDPAAIISAVIAGIPEPDRARVVREPDRRAAIGLALDEARPGDVVVIAGKGHETTQDLGPAGVVAFDDRVVAGELLGARR